MSVHVSDSPDNGLPSGASRTLGFLDKIGKRNWLKPKSNFEWDDLLLPYSQHQLPEDETQEDDPLKYTDRFIEEQNIYLTATTPSPESIWESICGYQRSKPPHIQATDIGKQFNIDKELGHGRLETWVHQVSFDVGGKPPALFAMKRMHKPLAPRSSHTRRNPPNPESKGMLDDFRNECANMRKCEHRHLVTFHASFTDHEYFGIIMSPAAKSTLEEVLDMCLTTNETDTAVRESHRDAVRKAFGCLLGAVRYLHDRQIKHRDLKPTNILLDGHRILVCDFGSTYDWEPIGREESTEESQAGTKKYKAPEVLQDPSSTPRSRHNSKTDIFSLGCVFLEMHTILIGQTLDRMAQYITGDRISTFGGNWTYASELTRVGNWLDQLKKEVPPGYQEAPASLIRKMICKESNTRDSADNLVEHVRRTSSQYIGDCCKESRPRKHPKPAMDEPRLLSRPRTSLPMTYSTPRSFTRYYIGRRSFITSKVQPKNQNSSSYTPNEHSSPYPFFAESQQKGQLEVKESDGAPWTTTRSIVIRAPSLQEFWLPAYFVLVARDGRKVILKWSDCNHKVQNSTNGIHEFSKVYYRSSSLTNMHMDIVLEAESDARDLCKLLLRDPTEDQHLLCTISLPDSRTLTVREYAWESTGDPKSESKSGSRALSMWYSPAPPRMQRLESYLLPDGVDLSWSLGNTGQSHIDLTIIPAWTPQYLSDQDPVHEEQGDDAKYKKTKLVSLSEGYTVRFTEDPANPNTKKEGNRSQYIKSAAKDFQRLLSNLTGLDLLAAFAVTVPQMLHKELPADVLCFRKPGDTTSRVALRWKGRDGTTTGWTTATLVRVLLATANVLKINIVDRQDGESLGLVGLTIVRPRAKNTECLQFRVEQGSVYPPDPNISTFRLAELIEPVNRDPGVGRV